MNIPQVSLQHAAEYGKDWSYKGVLFVTPDPARLQFATDFCNEVLRRLFSQMAAEANKPKIISTE